MPHRTRRTPRLFAVLLGLQPALAAPAATLAAQTTAGAGTALGSSVEPNAAVLATPEEALQLELDRALRGAAGERAVVGAEVRSLARDDVLYSLNAERLLQPASNAKLFIVAAALHYLGPDFSFRTTLYGSGPVDPDGVLRGDLVLEGRGDANLSGRFYGDSVTYVIDCMVDSLRARGIQRVAGDLVGDNSYFEGPKMGEGWAWDTQQWWYSAQIDALSFNDNVLTIAALPGPQAGAPARIRKIPDTAYVEVRNEVRTVAGRSGAMLTMERKPETNVVRLEGRVPLRSRGASVIVTVDDPARYTLTVFRERLLRAGIQIDGATRLAEGGYDPATRGTWTPLAVHQSPPLGEIVKVVNKRSQNFYAEQLLKTIGAEARGEGSAAAGLAAVHDFLRREAGVEPGSVTLADGSGLSPFNLVTPHALVQLLEAMARHRYAAQFYDSLLVPGEDAGAYRLDEPLTRGNVHAKTGTVRNVSAYSGYVTARDGERLAFSILVNNRPGGKGGAVQLENSVVRALARFTR